MTKKPALQVSSVFGKSVAMEIVAQTKLLVRVSVNVNQERFATMELAFDLKGSLIAARKQTHAQQEAHAKTKMETSGFVVVLEVARILVIALIKKFALMESARAVNGQHHAARASFAQQESSASNQVVVLGDASSQMIGERFETCTYGTFENWSERLSRNRT